MKFTADLFPDFESRKEAPKKNGVLNFIYLVAWLICIVFIFDFLPKNIFLSLIFVISIIIILYDRFSYLFEEEEYLSPIGKIEISENNLNWNKEIINWNEIDKVKCTLYGSISPPIPKGYNSFGILEHEIYILTKSKKEFKASILFKDRTEESELNKIKWDIVKSNDFSYENAKGLINPGSYLKHKELRDFLKSKNLKK